MIDYTVHPTPNGAAEVPKAKALPQQAYHLVKADLNRVREVWPQVRRGCLAVKAHCAKHGKPDDSGNWTAEHVRAQIELGLMQRSSCELWLICDPNIADTQRQVKGFLVTVVSNCPYLQVPLSLLVWVTYTFRPIGGRNARAILNDVEDYGRNLGVRYVDGYSNNAKWGSWLQRYGRGYRAAVSLIRKELWE